MLSVQHQRQHLRRTAWITLIAWLLALTAGVANACLLQTPAAGTAAAALAAPAALAVHPTAADHEHPGDDGGAARPGRAGCQKFCTDESSTLAKDKAQLPDFSLLAVVEFALQPRPDDTAGAKVVQNPAAPPDRSGPSLVIWLQRLTR